jgi:hypothetical protein
MMAGRRLALLISTDLYEDVTFRQLAAPGADVEALQAVLADPAIGGYAVKVLSNTSSHEVNQAIEGFFAEAKLQDLVLLYFSGHGFKDVAGRLYLITQDSRQQLLGSTAVSAQFVREQLDNCRSRRKIVLLDCCYAGAFPAGATPRAAGAVDVLGRLAGRGSAVITATSALGYAFEAGSSEYSSAADIAAPSIFTGALIEGLATGNADLDGDGLIDIDELYEHVYMHVREIMPQQIPGRRSDVEGNLYLATSIRGPRPAQLPPEISDAVQHPLPSVRLAVVADLMTLCAGARPSTLAAARAALGQLSEDDSRRVATAAVEALQQARGQVWQNSIESTSKRQRAAKSTAIAIADAEREANDRLAGADEEIAQQRAATEKAIAELRATADRQMAQLRVSTERDRDEILTTSKRQADEILSQARQVLAESEAQRAEAKHGAAIAARREEASRQEAERLAAAQAEVHDLVTDAEQRAATAERRAAEVSAQVELVRGNLDQRSWDLISRGNLSAAQREVAKRLGTADHEAAEKRAASEREVAKMRTTAEREVAQMRASSKRERDEILTTSKRQADEMRSHAQRILEESEAQRAPAEAEFDIQLAARREEAERQEAERLAAAQAATRKLVSEAEQRAATAEQRATKASAQAEQTRRDADQHSVQLVSNAKKNADQIVAQAKAQADQLLADTKSEADWARTAAQRHVDDLNKQKDSVAAHLAQISQLLGNKVPGLADALKLSASAPAPAIKPSRAAPAVPTGGGTAKQPTGGKSGKGSDEEWWNE